MTEPDPFAARSMLVTGASGIVGSWLVRSLLGQGASVVALIRDADPRSELFRSGDDRRVVRVQGDLEDLNLLERIIVKYEIEVIFHLGAQTQVRHAEIHPFATLEANVRGTYNLLEAARRCPASVVGFVVASSDKAYGRVARLPYREEDPLAGASIYDASKSSADLLTAAYARTFGLPIGIARCGNIYGGGDLNWDRIVPGTIRSLLQGQRPIIRSDGTLRRDYLYVDDAVGGYLALARALVGGRERGEAFNFGHGVGLSVVDLVKEIGLAVDRSDLSPDIRSDVTNEIQDQWLDSTKARTRLEWEPSIGLPEGLALSVDWYRRMLGSAHAG